MFLFLFFADDWLETDSGVFDFLGSSATTPSSIDGTRRNTFDIDSIPSLGSVESVRDFNFSCKKW